MERERGWDVLVQYRSTVAKLREQYRKEFPDHIARVAEQAPPFTAGQMAFLRRCIRHRTEVPQ